MVGRSRLSRWGLQRHRRRTIGHDMSATFSLLVGGAAFAVLGFGRLVRSQVLRHLAGVPRLARDVVALLLYVLVVATVLRYGLNMNVGGLLAGTAVVTVVLGFALQETLGALP